MRNFKNTVALLALTVTLTGFTGISHAALYEPVIDEFWIVKNGTEIFRDAFDGGGAPPSGPDGAATYSVGTSGAGLAGGEAGGKLTMTPSLGSNTLITGVFADKFTGALRNQSTNSGNANFLGLTDAFTINALYDLSASALPTITGQGFGIRATDRALGLAIPNLGNNVASLRVVKSGISGNIGVSLAEIDFIGDTLEPADFDSIQGVLGTATQIQLTISKVAGSDAIGASYIVFDSAMNVLQMAILDTALNDVLGNPLIRLYDGENFIRGQFDSFDRVLVPLPAAAWMFLTALSGLGLFGWRRRRATA